MNNRYSKEFELRYYEVNQYGEATPLTLLHYLEETAVAHSESLGVGIDQLKARGMGWVLHRWLLEVDLYPCWGNKVVVETWASNFDRFYATRQFLLKDDEGNELARAVSLWIFLDLERKRPMRIPEDLARTYQFDLSRAIEKGFDPITDLKDNQQQMREFFVRRSDIDTNGHVNNSNYVEWMLETVPELIYNRSILSSLEVIYQKEIGYGAAVYSYCGMSREEMDAQYIHQIVGKDENKPLAIGRTTWRRRKASE